MNDDTPTIPDLEDDERMLVLRRFDHDLAWRLGCLLRERAAAEGHAVALDVRRPSGAVLFHASLAGATADQDDWIRRKSAVALRFECSSALVAARFAAAGVDAAAMGWLDPADYAPAGGAIPVRVTDAGIVAVATVSGLASDADHALVADALRALQAELSEEPAPTRP